MEYKDKVLLVTGAAHGLGKQMAIEGSLRGMKLYLVDIDEEALQATAEELRQNNVEVLTLTADVSLFSENEKMFNGVMEAFGRVDVLVLNAGVSITAKVWELPAEDIDWIAETNFNSIPYGTKLFVPQMLKQEEEAHIVITASAAGLFTVGLGPLYHATKAAAVVFSESISMQLTDTNIKVHCLCPAMVQTDLYNYQNHRPERFKEGLKHEFYTSGLVNAYYKRGQFAITNGIPVDSIGMSVFQAIDDDVFYIITHPEVLVPCEKRVKMIVNGEKPFATLG